MIGITRALAISGAVDLTWLDEEGRWRGSEIHKIIELADRGKLKVSSVPTEFKGYLAAHEKFMRETGFLVQKIEEKVKDGEGRYRGRVDRVGLWHGKSTVVDFKTGAIVPAVRLQLALGGYAISQMKWWQRTAVELRVNGEYSCKHFPISTYHADLAVGLACIRLSAWKIQNGLA